MRRKLRRTAAAVLGLLMPAVLVMPAGNARASSPRDAAEQVTVRSYPVSTKIVATARVGAGLQVPALAPAPDGSDAEWMIINGGRQDLIAITPTGAQKTVTLGAFQSDNGPPDVYQSVDADGFDWVLDNDQGAPENSLYAVGAASSLSPGVNPVATFNGYTEDMTLGSDGALYVTDNAGNIIRCVLTKVPSATCATTPLNGAFDGGGYTIGAGAGLTWFTDADGELGTISSTQVVSGPYGDPGTDVGALSIDPGTIVGAANGNVYAAGGSELDGGPNDEILAGTSATPSTLQAVAMGVTNVVAMTIGPDGNLWFLDAGAYDGAGAVGTLNLTTNVVAEYPLPSGLVLPAGARIAPGPAVPDTKGYGEVFFSGTSPVLPGSAGTGVAAVGEATGIRFPVVAGAIRLPAKLSVSSRRLATLTLTCAGLTNAQCVGRFKFSAVAKLTTTTTHTTTVRTKGVKGKKKAHRKTSLETNVVIQGKRVSLGSVSYALHGTESLKLKLKLSSNQYRLLEEVTGHTLKARVNVTSKLGKVTGRSFKLVGPKPASEMVTTTVTTRTRKATTTTITTRTATTGVRYLLSGSVTREQPPPEPGRDVR